MATRTAYAGTAVAGDAYTAANHTRMPGGWIGHVEKTANQTGISSETALTSLSVAPTVGSTRRLRISGRVSFKVSAGNATVILRLKEDGAVVAYGICQPNDGIDDVNAEVWAIRAPSSGSHTYALFALVETGTVDAICSATNPGVLFAEDVGPAS